jgi:hypothetical protein
MHEMFLGACLIMWQGIQTDQTGFDEKIVSITLRDAIICLSLGMLFSRRDANI